MPPEYKNPHRLVPLEPSLSSYPQFAFIRMDKHIESQANFGTNGAVVYTMLHKVLIYLFYDLDDIFLQMV